MVWQRAKTNKQKNPKLLLQICGQDFQLKQSSWERDWARWSHSIGNVPLFFSSRWLSYITSTSLLYLQLGTFRSHDGDYFIEPLLSIDEQEDEEEQNKPHIIYRRSTPRREPLTGRHACDTPGICFLLDQRSWLHELG